jgi:hypothetical protein
VFAVVDQWHPAIRYGEDAGFSRGRQQCRPDLDPT